MEQIIDKIIRRQFERCKGELLSVNCPQIYIDCFSKYLRYANEDINKEIGNQNHDTITEDYDD